MSEEKVIDQKKQKGLASSALFLVKKEDKKPEKLEVRRQKLLDEVESWKSFAQALRIEDRRLLNSMLEKIWPFDSAVENCKEGYETEAFLLGLLILQQKMIDRLEELIKASM